MGRWRVSAAAGSRSLFLVVVCVCGRRSTGPSVLRINPLSLRTSRSACATGGGLCAGVKIADAHGPIDVGEREEDLKFKNFKFQIEA